MAKVKLLSNIKVEDREIEEGSVVDLPDEQVAQLVKVGAAEPSEEAVTPAKAKEEVEPATDPLVSTQPAGDLPASQEAPVTPPTSTPEQPASSSTNLHLG
jgi:hypothetical protein